MKKAFIISLTILQSFSLAARGQDTVRLSLPNIYTQIDQSWPQLQFYESKVNSIRALAAGARAWMPPTVSVALDRFPYQLTMINEMIPDNQAALMISVQQMIPSPARLRAKRDYLSSLENVQRNELQWQINTLHYTAGLYYYRRYTAEQKLKLIGEYRELLNLLINTAKDKYAYNQAELSTIFKAEASRSELLNMETMEEGRIAESTIGLNTLINKPVDQPFSIDTLLVPKDYSADYLLATDTARLLRNDILAMQSNIRSMALNRKWMAQGSRPDFGIQLTHANMFGMPDQFSIMGMMTIPIVPWSSKMYRSEVKSMGFEIEAMQKEKSTMQLMAAQMIRETITMLMYEKKQLDNYNNHIIPAYRRNLESNLLAYRQNTGNFFVLLDAWNMLLMKEMERIDKLGEVFRIQSEFEYQREIK
jgi:outer membrane protein TolC